MSAFGSILRQLRALPGASGQRNPGIASQRSISRQPTSGRASRQFLQSPLHMPLSSADNLLASAVPPATVRSRLDRDVHFSAASSACSETINTADVYRAVEGRLGSLSTSPVVGGFCQSLHAKQLPERKDI